MGRLNNRAFNILLAELKNCAGQDGTQKIQQQIVLKRLEKLRLTSGQPASLEELREMVVDMFPQFSETALKEAAKANRSAGTFQKIKWAVGTVAISGGVLWVLNLPYPMIRLPVAQTVPILLLPSYMSMDYHYRQAISQIEQADQLVNNATSLSDFDVGAEKVRKAQQHLNALPVWFLDYWPQYTFWLGWRFTFDEFRSARANVARMEAIVLQQKNAQTQLTQGEAALTTARQQYEQVSAPIEKKSAIAAWQAALDQLQQIPPETLAGRTAQKKLESYQRDYQAVVGETAERDRASTFIQAAQGFAWQAAKASQNPPHSVAQWQQIESLWQEAIARLEQVPSEDLAGYGEAQKLLAQYKSSLGEIQIRRQTEAESLVALEQAQDEIQDLLRSTPTDAKSLDRNRTISQLEGIINQLEKVQPGTTAYKKAQELLGSAKTKLKELNP